MTITEQLLKMLSDWWRGYSDEDMRAAILLMTGPFMVGSVVQMSRPQFKAWLAHSGRFYEIQG